MISIKNLNKVYTNEQISVHVLKDINLQISRGEFIAITGSSGSGKSTLMNIMGGLDSNFTGFYALNDVDVLSLDDKKISFIRNKSIGFVFQSFNLLKNITAIKNIELPFKRWNYNKRWNEVILMFFLEILNDSIINLKVNKFRSFLTMLGIIIGISSVIAIASLGEGGENLVVGKLKERGYGKFNVSISELPPP